MRGRKQWQFASRRGTDYLSRVLQPQRDTHDLFDDPGSYLQRRYHYDKAGELASSSDRQRGASVYRYLHSLNDNPSYTNANIAPHSTGPGMKQ
ncbi:hypothetical protein C4J96_1965 [Pseudomonas orientalis]|nr:hypothetical protein C4J96_1965 [Pseudomonas orientalis]